MSRYISALPAAPLRRPRRLALLGSTGSIGRSALEVVRLSPERFTVLALAGARNIPLLAAQAAEFRPACLAILEEKDLPGLRALLPSNYNPDVFFGQRGYESVARLAEADMVLSAQVGAAGLRATWAAVQSGKIVALANKESLVLAGDLIRRACAQSGACILPVDSEHNAVFQCLAGSFAPLPDVEDAPGVAGATGAAGTTDAPGAANSAATAKSVTRLILTASGGPFFGKSRAQLARVTPALALKHPNWTMGAKVTIDSATLMNKGLELIEARHLYGLPMQRLEVLVHRESIIHSLVEFEDHSQLAQLGQPDMRVPIAFCLAWPERAPTGAAPLDLAALGRLTFARPDEEAFPCLGLARRAQEHGRGAPVVLNAANEEAVAAFLADGIGFMDIPRLVEHCLEEHAAGRLGPDTARAACAPRDGGQDNGPDDWQAAEDRQNADKGPDSVEAVLALDAETRAAAGQWLRRAR